MERNCLNCVTCVVASLCTNIVRRSTNVWWGCGVGVAPLSVASRGKESAAAPGTGLVLVVGAVLGATLLLVNVLLVVCCLRRRANKRVTGECLTSRFC